jgi:hypothetical protein
MGSYNEPYKEGRPIKSAKGADVAKSVLGEVKKASDRTSLTDSGVLRKGSFKLRNGAGKMDSYSAMQKKGLISPMQVEDPPKKKGKTIMDMSNAEIYRLQKEGKFGGEENKSMKMLLNSPRGKDYSTFKSYRDKEIANRSKVVTDQSVEKRKETDQQKSYGTDDWKKKQTQKAGKVFDAKGSQLYPGQEGHSEARVKAAKEGYSKDVEVKRL